MSPFEVIQETQPLHWVKRARHRWKKLFRVAQIINHTATLGPRQIYIIPTRWGLIYGLMLFALLVGAINYSLSLAYFVTFLLASLANVAILHTWRNLAYLQVSIISSPPVFAGDIAEVHLSISETKSRNRYAVSAHFVNNSVCTQDIDTNSDNTLTLTLNTDKRGYLTFPKIKLFTEFPLSLFHAWSMIDTHSEILVYPKPSQDSSTIPSVFDLNIKGNHFIQAGDEDFIGHKTYQIGDLPSKVDWKASSRGIGMFTKLHSGEATKTLYLDWAYTHGDTEARISQMTRWVIDAQAAHVNYGLTLPNNVNFSPNHGEAHFHACLKALAIL